MAKAKAQTTKPSKAKRQEAKRQVRSAPKSEVERECFSAIAAASAAFDRDGDHTVRRLGSAQVIIAWTAGILVCEAPGIGGAARTKIDGIDFESLPPAIQAALIAQRDRGRSPLEGRSAPQAKSLALQEQRFKDAHEAGAERIRKHIAWIETLPPEQAAYEREKLAKIQARQRELVEARAKEIWQRTAERHSIDLANRVIDNPKRRPKGVRPSAARVAKAKNGNNIDLGALREGIDYKVYSW